MKIFKEIKILPSSKLDGSFIVRHLDITNPDARYYIVSPRNLAYYIPIAADDSGYPRPIQGNTNNFRNLWGNNIAYNRKKQRHLIRGYTQDGIALTSKKAYEIFHATYPVDNDPIAVYGNETLIYSYNELRPHFVANYIPSKFTLELWDTIHDIGGGMVEVRINYGYMRFYLINVNKIILDYLEAAANENI